MTINNQETAKRLKNVLKCLLGEDGINVLGEYELRDDRNRAYRVPSVKIQYERIEDSIKRKLVTKEVEAIVYPTPQTIAKKYSFQNRNKHNYFAIVLVQHNPRKLLDEAIDEILKCPWLNITEEPDRIGERKQEGEGSIPLPPQATLYHCQSQLLISN